jgi:LPPG:FO 2-phospho-L-lactate transferase
VTERASTRVVLLAGGSGGAKLAAGFQAALTPGSLTVIGNVADDFELFGLHISPDLDSIMYALAGLTNPDTGWGVTGDSFDALEMLERYGEPAWFRIGDRDLATHVHRTRLLRDGVSLTDATHALVQALGVGSRLLPACEEQLRTVIQTDAGQLTFQEYFVEHAQRDEVRGIELQGIAHAEPTSAVRDALAEAELVVIAPSNPIVSIGPILEIPGMRAALLAAPAPRIAVSPIVAGRALKGPTDRMLASLGHEVSALGVARLYQGLVDRFVLDRSDAGLADAVAALGMSAGVLPTVMRTDAARATLARGLLEAAR